MSYTSFIAGRYRKANRGKGFTSFISGTAIVGVALGVAALIIALSVLGGFEREITEKIIGFTSHIQVVGFHNQPLSDFSKNISRIENESPLIRAVQPYVAREALIRSKESVDGILLKGIDPSRDISAVQKYIVRGTYDIERKAGALPNIVIGRKLADKLALTVGDKTAVFATGNTTDLSQMRVMQFRVSGLYESGMADYDDVFAFTSLQDAQVLFQYRNTITGYDVLISDLDSADVIADRVQALLRYPHYARTVFQNYRNLFSWIELQKKPVPIILGLIIIVATVNIIGTLLMVVIGKTKEIGILRSLGASRRGIVDIFVRQGIWIGIVGTTIGNLFAFALCYTEEQFHFLSLPSDIYFMTSVPILLRPEYFLIVSAISIALCYVCSLLPALLASRIDPVRAIRFA